MRRFLALKARQINSWRAFSALVVDSTVPDVFRLNGSRRFMSGYPLVAASAADGETFDDTLSEVEEAEAREAAVFAQVLPQKVVERLLINLALHARAVGF